MLTTTYKGFNIKTNYNDAGTLAHLKKTVDDYELECKPNHPITQIDAARIAMSQRVACQILKPMSVDQALILRRMTLGLNVGSVAPALAPNRIEIRHVTRSSRVRNLVHAGMLGLLAVKLMNDTNQSNRRGHTFNFNSPLCIIRRVNGQAGCEHVKWSISEFNCRYNIGVKYFKRGHNPFEAMNHDEILAQLTLINTDENRQMFIEKCKSVANVPNLSRVKYSVVAENADADSKWVSRRHHMVLSDDWFAQFMSAFTQACFFKMAAVSNDVIRKIDRVMNLVELYHFMASTIDWILIDHRARFMINLHYFWEKYMDKLINMSGEGIEHSAYMFGRYFPEMMTPELHVVVNPIADVYRVPQTQIAHDDVLFGPMKAACQAFMPVAVAVAVVAGRGRIYSDSDSDSDSDYYNDHDNYPYDNDDYAQG